jgi:hypothetical protein
MFVIPSEFDEDAAKLVGYAVTHSMVTALANFGSTTGGLAAAGRSGIWSQAGELLVQLRRRVPRGGDGKAVIAVLAVVVVFQDPSPRCRVSQAAAVGVVRSW